MGYVIGLKTAESRTENLISIRHSVAEIFSVKVQVINNFGNNFANMAAKIYMHEIENKSLCKEEMNYGCDT